MRRWIISSSKRKSQVRYRSLADNPTDGIEYNEIAQNYKISSKRYWVDVASNPNVIKEKDGRYIRMDVQAKASKINGERYLINYNKDNFKGR